MAKFVKVAKTSDITPGTAKKIEIGEREIAVFNIDGTFHAIDEMCPHRGGPLSESPVEGNIVACSWHGWEFDVTTGVSRVNPAAKVNCYPVKVEGDDVFVSA